MDPLVPLLIAQVHFEPETPFTFNDWLIQTRKTIAAAEPFCNFLFRSYRLHIHKKLYKDWNNWCTLQAREATSYSSLSSLRWLSLSFSAGETLRDFCSISSAPGLSSSTCFPVSSLPLRSSFSCSCFLSRPGLVLLSLLVFSLLGLCERLLLRDFERDFDFLSSFDPEPLLLGDRERLKLRLRLGERERDSLTKVTEVTLWSAHLVCHKGSDLFNRARSWVEKLKALCLQSEKMVESMMLVDAAGESRVEEAHSGWVESPLKV